MWQRHWGLSRNPFDERNASFVAIPGHVEAVARLVHSIESAERSARLVADAGLGKSMVVARALELTRSPARRMARVSMPVDAADLFGRLATSLGRRVAPGASRSIAWRSLLDAVRVCRWQRLHVVLVVDDAHQLESGPGRGDLDRLQGLDPDPATRLSVVRISRPTERDPGDSGLSSNADDWSLAIPLQPLTRSEVSGYLEAKLAVAGRDELTFSPRAVSRVQALSGGIPQRIDRLATLTLMASALRGLGMVTPEIFDEAAQECQAVGAGSWQL